jgi:hypothetical protein
MPKDEPVSRPPPHEASYLEWRLLSYKDEVFETRKMRSSP